jgi:hypothetical protein
MRVILECRREGCAKCTPTRILECGRMRHIQVTGEGNRANAEPIFFARSLLRVNLEWRSGGCAKFCARNFECTGVLKHRARMKLEIYSNPKQLHILQEHMKHGLAFFGVVFFLTSWGVYPGLESVDSRLAYGGLAVPPLFRTGLTYKSRGKASQLFIPHVRQRQAL